MYIYIYNIYIYIYDPKYMFFSKYKTQLIVGANSKINKDCYVMLFKIVMLATCI